MIFRGCVKSTRHALFFLTYQIIFMENIQKYAILAISRSTRGQVSAT